MVEKDSVHLTIPEEDLEELVFDNGRECLNRIIACCEKLKTLSDEQLNHIDVFLHMALAMDSIELAVEEE